MAKNPWRIPVAAATAVIAAGIPAACSSHGAGRDADSRSASSADGHASSRTRTNSGAAHRGGAAEIRTSRAPSG